MTRAALLWLSNTLLFFAALFFTRFTTSERWALGLYPLFFSIGTYLWLLFTGTVRRFFGRPERLMVLSGLFSALLLFALLEFLKPIVPGPPDPFVKTPKQLLDWHTILRRSLPLPFLLALFGSGLQGLLGRLGSERPPDLDFVTYTLTFLMGLGGTLWVLSPLPLFAKLAVAAGVTLWGWYRVEGSRRETTAE